MAKRGTIAVSAIAVSLLLLYVASPRLVEVDVDHSADLPQRSAPEQQVDLPKRSVAPPAKIVPPPPRRVVDSNTYAVMVGAPATASTVCPHGATAEDYFRYFSELVSSHLGTELSQAVYDPEMLGALARAAASGSLGDEDTFVWHIGKLRAPPIAPISFASPASMLRLAKRMISVGLGRVHRDSEVGRLYAHTCGSATAAPVFRRALVRVVEAYVNYFYTMLQLSLDAMAPASREAMIAVQKKPEYPGADILTHIMMGVDHSTTLKQMDDLLSMGTEPLLEMVKAQRLNPHRVPGRQVQAMFPLEYEVEHFGGQRPVNGKFWNMIRPTASCTSLVRLCEKPDGCRLLCNAEYLLHAGLQSGAAAADAAVYNHRLAGFGSNNEYDWELSLVKMFDAASRATTATSGSVHRVGWFTVFDCTLGSGARRWTPPDGLTEAAIGFGYASKCLDGKASSTAYGFKDVKEVLLGSEAAQKDGKAHESVTRRVVSKASLAAGPEDHRLWRVSRQGTETNNKGPRLFDALTILKVDVEGYEFNAMPSWGRDELRNLGTTSGTTALAKGSTALIDFETAIDNYLSVSLLSMEFHRSGHKYPYGANLRGAQRSHYTLLHIYSLGFVMTGQEKNHQDNCCYELVWVHYRHFIRSEVWMVLGDGLL